MDSLLGKTPGSVPSPNASESSVQDVLDTPSSPDPSTLDVPNFIELTREELDEISSITEPKRVTQW
jgi:hypothetical protein